MPDTRPPALALPWCCISKDYKSIVPCSTEADARELAAGLDAYQSSGAPHVVAQLVPQPNVSNPPPEIDASAGRVDADDAARYRAFFDAGLPITFMGEDYYDKPALDAAIDRARKD